MKIKPCLVQTQKTTEEKIHLPIGARDNTYTVHTHRHCLKCKQKKRELDAKHVVSCSIKVWTENEFENIV